jgi:hypothetical protein
MGAYSALCLVANQGFRVPTDQELHEFFGECGLLNPERSDHRFGNLTSEFWDYFSKLPQRAENESLFRPDTISGRAGVTIHDYDGDYAGPGYTISISGAGYFWPLSVQDLQSVVNGAKLSRLALEMGRRFGGSFVTPRFRGRRTLKKNRIEVAGDWCWFGSQSL